jgi:hypothetical protein
MDEDSFQRELSRARTCGLLEPEREAYWRGFQRGLRRAHLGKQFGTDEEHALWLTLAKVSDRLRRECGEGYRDGLAAGARPGTGSPDGRS